MSQLLNDLKYGLRSLLRAPAFSLAAILALGLGIGSTTAIFSIVNGVVLKPLPYEEPERLMTIWEVNREKGLDQEPLSPVNFLDYRALTQVFDDAAAWWRPQVTLSEPGREPLRVNAIEASGNFLAVLGTRPALGAGFPEGVMHSPDRLVLVSQRLWESRFQSDPDLIGRSIALNGNLFTVAGVLRLTAVGLVVGLGASFGLTRLLQAQLFNVKPSDPGTMASVAAFIAMVALVACYVPASRATRVDPMVVLRDE